MGLIGLTF